MPQNIVLGTLTKCISKIPNTVSGIYRLRNRRTGKTYVGGSRNVRDRIISHRQKIRMDTAPANIQAGFPSGVAELVFGLLEECDPADLYVKELEWIKRLRPALNKLKDPSKADWSSVDWNKTDTEISRSVGRSRERVGQIRESMGLVGLKGRGNQDKPHAQDITDLLLHGHDGVELVKAQKQLKQWQQRRNFAAAKVRKYLLRVRNFQSRMGT